MALLLLQLGAHPDEIAATQVGACRDGGAFFLDFGRPLRKLRWCGFWNPLAGLTMSLSVPVVHEADREGRHVIAVDRGDPYFAELQRLWKERFPRQREAPPEQATPERIEADFRAQFPDDAPPRSG